MKSENIDISALRCAPLSFVEAPQQENETQRVLRRALELMGPNGENWIKWTRHDLGGKRCALGAIMHVKFGSVLGEQHHGDPAAAALDMAAVSLGARCENSRPLVNLNNRATSFSEVREMFERAIALAASPLSTAQRP